MEIAKPVSTVEQPCAFEFTTQPAHSYRLYETIAFVFDMFCESIASTTHRCYRP